MLSAKNAISEYCPNSNLSKVNKHKKMNCIMNAHLLYQCKVKRSRKTQRERKPERKQAQVHIYRKKDANVKPEQCGWHQAQTLHWKPKNHKGDYTGLTFGSHPCTPISFPYIPKRQLRYSECHKIPISKLNP